jgi:hypothetical protein
LTLVEGSPRALINDNARRDSNYDKPQDEKHVSREAGSDRDILPQQK